jgi:Cd2+/Zn2+-exporting ATPase/Cu+-exporting ATPase
MKTVTGSSTVEMAVPGLCCIECSQDVVSALKRAEGVLDLVVLGTAEKVRVTYDAGATTPEALVRLVEQTGHAVAAWRPVRTAPRIPVVDHTQAAAAEQPLSALTHGPVERTVSPPEVQGGQPDDVHARRDRAFATLRLAFLSLVALIALVEIAGESLGLFRGLEELIPVPVALAAVVLGGYPIFRGAFLGLRQRQINTDAVMSVGILAAAAIGQFVSAALIVFFVMVAHYLEDLTTGRSRRAISELVALMPRTAQVKRSSGEEEMPIEAVQVGDVVVVRPGERIPIDGTVLVGHATVNQAPITGESLPVEKEQGDEVFAATVNEVGYLEINVQRVGEETMLGRIIQLVEEAETHKAPVQRFADRFSAVFLPLVLTAAALTLLFTHNIVAAIAVLVAACPCAVGLATPLSVVAAVGAGARRGLLIKGGLSLELLAKVDTLVVDKTGTLTHGRPRVTDVISFVDDQNTAEVVARAAALEHYSEHPLASAVLVEAAERGLTPLTAREVQVLPGRGLSGQMEGRLLLLGTRRLLGEQGITLFEEQERQVADLESEGKTVLLLAEQGVVLGALAVADTLRADVPAALAELRRLGVRQILLLTGDNERVARAIARQAGITEVAANLLPEDKIATVKRLQAEGRRVAMVGDGINDAPALTQADVGIAMGVTGTDVALEAADVALMRDDWRLVPEAIRLGRRTYRTIRQNILFGIAFNVLVMGLAAVSLIGPVIAAASQAVPDVAVALNASRLLGAGRRDTPTGRSGIRTREKEVPDAA